MVAVHISLTRGPGKAHMMNSSDFWKWAERILLVCVLAMQVLFLLRDRRPPEADAGAGDDLHAASVGPGGGASSSGNPARDAVPGSSYRRFSSFFWLSLPDHQNSRIYSPALSDFSGIPHPDRLYTRMSDIIGRSVRELDIGWDSLISSPAMDMRVRDDDYLITASVPGASSDQVNVFLKGRLLTVIVPVGRLSTGDYQLYQRRFLLPGLVGPSDLASAVLSNGVLRVVVPKSKEPVRNPSSVAAYRLM